MATFATLPEAEYIVVRVGRRLWDDDGEHDFVYSLPEFEPGNVDSVFAVQDRIAKLRKLPVEQSLSGE